MLTTARPTKLPAPIDSKTDQVVQKVELASKNFAPATFGELATRRGMPYVSIDGLEPGLPMWLRRRRLIDADIVVDLDALTRVLDDAGIR